jgi:metallophosphoesterase (TIGR00282 family)
MGNHTYGKMQLCELLDDAAWMLRPANFAPRAPGRGWGIYEVNGVRIRVMNLIGRCDLDWKASDPFTLADRLIKAEPADITLVDFHAEATSEKLALGYYLNGRVSALWGTHTHVPTADAQVLPKGTGYVTDLGMTGPKNSVLGIKPELSIAKFRGDLTERYRWADGPTKMEAVLFTIDSQTGRCTNAERVDLCDENTAQR